MDTYKAAFRREMLKEFGTGKGFADALGMSEGNVSQMVNDPEKLKRETVERNLAALASPVARETLMRLWITEYAPLIELEPLPPQEALDRAAQLESSGFVGQALELVRISQEAAKEDDPLRADLLQRAAQYELKLARPGRALAKLDEAAEFARVRRNPFDIFTALWLRGITLRQIPVPSEVVESAFRDLNAYGASVANDGPRWRARLLEVGRDEAISILSAEGPEPDLDRANALADAAVEGAPDEHMQALSLEVRGRVELRQGRLFDAEESLEDAVTLAKGRSDMDRKAAILSAGIAEVRDELDSAEEAYARASAEGLSRGDLHSHHKAERLLARLLARRRRTRFF